MKKSIFFTAWVFLMAATCAFAQKEESRYINGAGDLVVEWSDGTRSTYGTDPTGKEDLEPDPKVAERMYDKHGNRREVLRNGKTRIIEAGERSVDKDRMNERPEDDRPAKKALKPEKHQKQQAPK